jgi:ferrochelatase
MKPMAERRERLAIVLFALGGPASVQQVRPFLLSLFSDPGVLRVPIVLRWWLARRIVARRLASAEATIRRLGGAAVLLAATEAQARALEAARPEYEARCFVAMRHAAPDSLAAARMVRAWGPDRVLLLPLYPQYSTTTTGSSLRAWQHAAVRVGLMRPTTTLCCWPDDPAFIAGWSRAIAEQARAARARLPPGGKLRLLFSAHGLPRSIIDAGDPYQAQVETGAAALAAVAAPLVDDWRLCYQSREATGSRWLGPTLEAEIHSAAASGTALLVVPLSFVSEHSETLVELDVEMAELAEKTGVPGFFRVPAPGCAPELIAALAALARRSLAHGDGLCSHAGGRSCARSHIGCPFARADAKEKLSRW